MSNSGKVKCTCGWSWNKSDSSKKDMYICHECGRDNSNNMKNGGWLDTYADGGTMQEHQENYNDPQVSLPEGFVGMGNNTKGRNYSPAWGGQFQMGGNIYPVNYVPQAAMGGSLPGAGGHFYARYEEGGKVPGDVGFDYPRTINPAPDNGPGAKKTMASAQNGQEMKYYQEGLDFKPKSISKNGGWLDGYDVAQNGYNFDKINIREVPEIVRDNTRVVFRDEKGKQREVNPNKQITTTKTKYNKAEKEKALVAERRAKLANSMAAQNENYTSDNWRELLARETQATGDKFRLFPEEDSFIDNWLNPGVMIGNMASNLGQAPYQAEQTDSYMPYVTAIGTPLTVGALAGYGANSNSQFVNNLVNPLAGINPLTGLKNTVKALGTEEGLLSNAWKLNPRAYQYNLPENTMWRGLGKTGLDDALENEVLRTANKTGNYGEDLYITTDFNTAKGNYSIDQPTYKGDPFSEIDDWEQILPKDTKSYIAEIPESALTNKNIVNNSSIVINKGSIPTNDVRLLKQDWWQGYKPIEVPGRNYFEGPLPIIPRNNMIQSSAIDSALEKELRPYISKIGEPSISREEEVFRNVMGHEYRDAKELENTIHLDSNGNIISNPDIKKPNLIKKDLSEGNNIKYEYFDKSGNKVSTFSGKRGPEGIHVNSVNVEPKFRRKGIASDIYKNITKDLQSKNEGTLLSRSTQHQFTDVDELGRSIAPANKLWENLVNKGEAEKFIEGMSHSYRMKPLENGGIIKDDMGYWNPDNWDSPVEIGSNEITMKHVPFDVLGISDEGDIKHMKPGKNYKYKGKKVTEFRMAKNGLRQEQKGLVNLDQLTNFTNYNKPQPGGWLNKYN